MSDFHFDAAIDRTCQEFQTTLAERLSTMELDDVVFVTPVRDQGEPLLFALRFGRSDGHVRSTVACDVSGCAPALQRLGWQMPRDGRFVYERPWTLRTEVARIPVESLRKIWSVPHPSYLAGLGRSRPDGSPVIGTAELGPDRLRALVRDELEEYAGGAFSINGDATITLPTAHIQSSIGVSPYAPRIDIFARIADDITRLRHAESIVADMASTWSGIQLVLDGTELYAAHLIDAETYSRDQLFAGLHHWFDFIDRGLPEIHRRLHLEPRQVHPWRRCGTARASS